MSVQHNECIDKATCNRRGIASILARRGYFPTLEVMTGEGSGVVHESDGRELFLEACRSPEAAGNFLKPHVGQLAERVAQLRARWNALKAANVPYRVVVPEPAFNMVCREEDLGALSTLENPAAVSLDVFDTCLNRLLESPLDVFQMMGYALEAKTGLPANTFASARVEVENALRSAGLEKGTREDTSFSDIYKELESRFQWDRETTEAIRAFELSLEQLFLRAVPEIQELAKKWKREGVQMAYTSEMYLPSETLRQLLKTAGFPVDDLSVLTSGETGFSKGTGKLYDLTVRELGTEGIVHIGDNPETDGTIPAARGFTSLVVRTAKAVYADLFSNVLHAVGTEPGVTGDMDFWERLGYQVAGPLHFAFATHLYRKCQSLGCERIHFLSRDGWFPRKVFQKIQSAWGVVAKDHYLYASREFLGLGSMTDIDPDDWEFILKASPLLELRDVFERLGIPAQDYEPVCHKMGLGDPERRLCHHCGYLDPQDHGRLYHAICQCIEPFHLHRNHVASRLREYLQDTGMFNGSSMFVDIGWGGSSFRAIQKLAPGDKTPHGAYFALFNEFGPGTSAYFTDASNTQRQALLMGSIALMEFLFGSPESTVRYMDRGSGEWMPVFREPLPTYDIEAWTGMERGVLKFTDRILEILHRAPDGDGLARVEDVLKRCIFEPDKEALQKLGPLSHGEGWGTRHRLRMLPAFKTRPAEPVLHEAYGYCPWKPGLKRILELGLA
ncbi:MAG: hypothetical protein AB3N33_06155 [Puniceicoccaceae bacterium]